MAVLFNGSVPISAGVFNSSAFAVPGGIKQAAKPLNLRLSLGAEQFPNGTTELTVFISTDGGTSYKSATMSVVMPAVFKGAAPHFWTMSYSLGANDNPTHARFSSNAPSSFTTTVLLEAL